MIGRLVFTVARVLCPSVPNHIAAICAATNAPGPVSCGEADTGPGHLSGGEGAPIDASAARVVVSEQVTPHPPTPCCCPRCGVTPAAALLISWHADRATTHLTDAAMWNHIDRWIGETR